MTVSCITNHRQKINRYKMEYAQINAHMEVLNRKIEIELEELERMYKELSLKNYIDNQENPNEMHTVTGSIVDKAIFGINDKNELSDIERYELCLRVLEEVAYEFGVDLEELISKKRLCGTVGARFAAMMLLRESVDMSIDEIGKVFHKQDHTTVMSSISKARHLMIDSESFSKSVERITSRIHIYDKTCKNRGSNE